MIEAALSPTGTTAQIDDRPLDPPLAQVPRWSENFALAAFEPSSGIGIFIHIGRWWKDIKLWRELVTIAYPDGTILAHRAVGDAQASADGPGGPCCGMRVIEEGRRAAYWFRGAARRVAAAELLKHRLSDGPLERLEYKLAFDATLPLWDISSVGTATEFMGRGHTEQPGRLHGVITVRDAQITFDSTANRDHSRGPRDNRSLLRHVWMQGYFDNGISVLAYNSYTPESGDRPAYAEACVYDGGQLYRATFEVLHALSHTDQVSEPFAMLFRYERGELRVDVTRLPNTIPLQFTSPSENYIGIQHLPRRATRHFVEQSAYMLLNGAVAGYGHVERSIPGEVIVEG